MADVNRRYVLAGLTAVLGAAGVAYMNPNAVEVGATYKPSGKNEFFSDAHMKLMARFVDIIIPETDTPGAAEAGVHLYMDHLAGSWMNEEEKAVLLAGLTSLDTADGGKNFLELDADAQVAIVQAMDDNRDNDKVYATLKAYAVTGYYTSEIGGTQELHYDPFPGGFKEVLLKDVGRLSTS